MLATDEQVQTEGRAVEPELAAQPAAPASVVSVGWHEVAVVLLLAFLVFALFNGRVTSYLSPLTGDEPSYVMTTISLLKDGDLNECNNYRQRDENGFYPRHYWTGEPQPTSWVGFGGIPYPLPPHWDRLVPESRNCTSLDPNEMLPTDGTGNEAHTWHGIGLSFMILPAYALGGLVGVQYFFNLLAALVALNIYLSVRERFGGRGLAAFTTATFVFAAPIIFYSYVIFTELPSALLTIYAFRRILLWRNTWAQHLVTVLCIAFLPWLHYRFGLIAAGLFACYVYQAWRNRAWRGWWLRHGVLVGTLTLSGGLILAYNYWLFQRLTIQSSSYTGGNKPPWIVQGTVGLLIDRHFGLFVIAPVFILIFVGIVLIWRRADLRATLAMIAMTFIPYYLLLSSFNLWWGTWGPPGRYFVSVLPLFAIPFALGFHSIRSWLYRAAYAVLLLPTVLGSIAFLYNPKWVYNFDWNYIDYVRELITASPFAEQLAGFSSRLVGKTAFPDFVEARNKGETIEAVTSARDIWAQSSGALLFIIGVTAFGLLLYWLEHRRAAAPTVAVIPEEAEVAPLRRTVVGIGGRRLIYEGQPLRIRGREVRARQVIIRAAQFGLAAVLLLFVYSNTIGLREAFARVEVISPAKFQPLLMLTQGADRQPLQRPRAVATDASGNIYVADNGPAMIHKFSKGGQPITTWAAMRMSGGADTINDLGLHNDRLYVAGNIGRVEVYDLSGNLTATLNENNELQINGVSGLYVAADGTIYLTDVNGGRIVKLNPAGELLGQIGNRSGLTTQQRLYQPFDSLARPDGSLYVTDARERLLLFDQQGNYVREWKLPSFLRDGSMHLAADGDRLYIVNAADNRLVALNLASEELLVYGEGGYSPGQFAWPSDVATDPSGNIYVTEFDSRRVQVFTRP